MAACICGAPSVVGRRPYAAHNALCNRRPGAKAMSEILLTDSPSEHIRVLTMNRPDQLNAMSAELCEALPRELDRLGAARRLRRRELGRLALGPSCRAIVITGAGRGFCAGVDLRGYGDAPGNDGSDPARDRLG